MTIQVNYSKALDLLTKAVDEHGNEHAVPDDERYEWPQSPGSGATCSYFWPPKADAQQVHPSCIVGHVIDYLGLREKFLTQQEDLEGGPAANALKKLGVQLTDRARVLIEEVQSYQDGGEYWGEAVSQAMSMADDGFNLNDTFEKERA